MPSAAQNPLNDGKSGSCAGAVEFSRHETPLCGISTSTRINTVSGAPFNKRGKAGVAIAGGAGTVARLRFSSGPWSAVKNAIRFML